MIQPGQIYRSLSTRHHPSDGPTRIRIVSATTRDGTPRRTGYVLETP